MPEQGWTPNPLEDLATLKRKAIDVGYPAPLTRDRILPVTRIRRKDVRDIVGAFVYQELADAAREGRALDWDKLKPVETALDLLISEKGQGRDELPFISSSYFAKQQPKRGLFRRRREEERYREGDGDAEGDGGLLP